MLGDGSVGSITVELWNVEAVVGEKKEKSLGVYFHSGGEKCVGCCCCGRVFGRLQCFAESRKLRKKWILDKKNDVYASGNRKKKSWAQTVE